jgi:hypothetical protein
MGDASASAAAAAAAVGSMTNGHNSQYITVAKMITTDGANVVHTRIVSVPFDLSPPPNTHTHTNTMDKLDFNPKNTNYIVLGLLLAFMFVLCKKFLPSQHTQRSVSKRSTLSTHP